MEGLLESLEHDSFARLRWLVCRELGIFPCSLRARALGRKRLLFCAANLALDRGRVFRSGEVFGPGNPEFDEERFKELAARV